MPPPKSAGRGDGQPVPVQSSSEQEQNKVSEEENKIDDEQIESSEASGFCLMFTWFVIIKKSRVVLEPLLEDESEDGIRAKVGHRTMGVWNSGHAKGNASPPKVKAKPSWLDPPQMHVPVPKIAQKASESYAIARSPKEGSSI